VPRKNCDKTYSSLPIFFSFCDDVQPEVSNWAIFQRDKSLLQVATCPLEAFSECSPLRARCSLRIAANKLHQAPPRLNWRARQGSRRLEMRLGQLAIDNRGVEV
jgi:hypothetical protein